MSNHSSSAVGLVESDAVAPVEIDADGRIEIEVDGRWDALALSERLVPFHAFLVQHEAQRWVVHARAPGCRGEDLDDALRVIGAWLAETDPKRLSCRVGGRPHELVDGRPERQA